jgi:hypothetical protein
MPETKFPDSYAQAFWRLKRKIQKHSIKVE